MNPFTYNGKSYAVDHDGFLLDHDSWDENFAEGMAREAGIPHKLSADHWKVLRYIRKRYWETGSCPLVYETCKSNGLTLHELKVLFPTGYHRGACKVAGLSYKDEYLKHSPQDPSAKGQWFLAKNKIYRVDPLGFLIDPEEWDEQFASNYALQMKIQEGLTDRHWKIIYFLRDCYLKNKHAPNVYETCEVNNLELDELERLFPTGYHRGALKISGLRAG